jgi:hypothetical protein
MMADFCRDEWSNAKRDDTESIAPMWQMMVNVSDASEPTGMWQSVYSGTDCFRR